MEGWPDDAKRTMVKVAKVIGDAVNDAPCPTCATLSDENALLRQRLTLTEAVVNAARKSVNNPAWAGICDEDIELEVSLRALEEGK